MRLKDNSKWRILTFLSVLWLFLASSVVYGQEPHKTGTVFIRESVASILGAEAASDLSAIVDINEPIKWKLVVPSNYNPENPAGVVYFFNFRDRDRLPVGWARSFDEKNLIVVRSVDDIYSNKSHTVGHALGYALVQKHYKVTSQRFYVTGTKLGCQAAADLAILYSEIVRGTMLANCISEFNKYEDFEFLEPQVQNPFLYVKNSGVGGWTGGILWDYIEENFNLTNTKWKSYSGYARSDNLRASQVIESIDYLDNQSENREPVNVIEYFNRNPPRLGRYINPNELKSWEYILDPRNR